MKEKQEDEAAPEEKEGNGMSHNYSHGFQYGCLSFFVSVFYQFNYIQQVSSHPPPWLLVIAFCAARLSIGALSPEQPVK